MQLVFFHTSNIYNFCIKYIEIISDEILQNNTAIKKQSGNTKDIFLYQNRLYSTKGYIVQDTKSLLEAFLNTDNISFKIDSSLNLSVSGIKEHILSDGLRGMFLDIFRREHSYNILLFLYTNSLLERFVKEFKNIKFLAQFDGYHQLPVCLHSIKSIWHFENIDDKDVLLVYKSLLDEDRFLLKLIIFFHDFGKGRKKDHSIIGSDLFNIFGQRYGLKKDDITTARTLIRHHILMSVTAIKEDIYNEKVIFSFVSQLKSKRVIDMMYVLTYADIKGTSPSLFTSHTSKLLSTLYEASVDAVQNRELVEESYRRRKKEMAILKDEKLKSLGKLTINKVLHIDSNLLFLKYQKEQIIELVQFALDTKRFNYRVTNTTHLNIEIIRVTPLNLGYLLGKLSFLDIVNMDIFRLFDNKKFFHIEFSSRVDSSQIADIENIVKNSFDMDNSVEIKAPDIKKTDILIDCNHSNTLAKMQINTKNGYGLFAYIAKLFDDFDIEIESAKIYTQKNRAKDLFLIEKNGNFCKNSEDIVDKLVNYK
jgi:[protein-PII] uridylyltransferase